jgi:gas vesicle protein
MKFSIFILISLFLMSFTHAQGVATVNMLKGSAASNGLPLKEGDFVKEGATISTTKGSFLRLKFNDQTTVSLGSEAEFVIKSYRLQNKKRNNSLRLLKGKMRVIVNKFAEEGEKIQFNSGQVALGVRGTEFLVNTLQLGGAPSSDALLIKGSLRASGPGFNAFTMSPGQYFNSQDLMRSGMSAVKKLSGEALNKLKESGELFLPDLKTDAGLTNLSQALGFGSVVAGAAGALMGAASGLIPAGDSDKEAQKQKRLALQKVTAAKKEAKKKKASSSRKVKRDTKVQGTLDFSYDLKKEKWDIRDAVMNRNKNKKKNICYYYFYKKLPGAGEPERFRRERDCDEFENDL